MAEPTDADRLAFASELLIGSVENGPWVLIDDPDLRRVVGEYVADTCYSVAAAAGLGEAMERAHAAMPSRLARSLPDAPLAPDARERLARHLYLKEWAADNLDPDVFAARWDNGEVEERLRRNYLRDADATLAVIAGTEADR